MGKPRIAWEFKFTSRPETLTRLSLGLQLGVYFWGCSPLLQRIVVRVLRFPDLRRKKDQPLEEYIDHIYKDIKRRPEHYIIDTNYWREEFNLNDIKAQVRRIQQDIGLYEKEGQDGYYKNLMACFSPYECPYLPLCETGVKDYKDSILTSALYKPKGDKHGIQGNLHDLREQRNWEDDLSI